MLSTPHKPHVKKAASKRKAKQGVKKLGSLDMERRDASQKIDIEATAFENIAPYKRPVIRIHASDIDDIKIDVAEGHKEHGRIERRFDRRQPGDSGNGVPDLRKAKFLGQTGPQPGTHRASVDLRAHPDLASSQIGRGANSDLNRRAMLDQVLDRLSKFDLGPSGFIVIAHRGS
jgi:hypothetical protein